MVDFTEITARVKVRDILDSCGISHDRERIPCPIHKGKNRTAFSYNDFTFCCFSCGAQGGLLDLVEHLYECSRKDAMKHLCKLAGIAWDETTYDPGEFRMIPQKPDPLLDNEEYQAVSERLEWHVAIQRGYDTLLRILRSKLRNESIPLSEFYSKEQYCLYRLQEMDAEVAESKCLSNRIKKGSSNVANRIAIQCS